MHPTEILSQQHRAIENRLDVFRNFADGCHHAKEENLLFPRMKERACPNKAAPSARC